MEDAPLIRSGRGSGPPRPAVLGAGSRHGTALPAAARPHANLRVGDEVGATPQPSSYATLFPVDLFLDTETTGSGPEDAVIEIGVVTARGETLVDTLVAPLAPVTEGARRVHGIAEQDLEGAPSFAALADRLGRAVARAGSVWAFSARYDKRMLVQTARLADRPRTAQRVRDGQWRDLQPWATDVLGDEERVSLTDAARRLDVSLPTEGRHHRALYDARLARRIWASLPRPR